jgi:hypothetical protein
MNKRGQMYILAAVILVLAVFSVTKVSNNFVAPPEDNFDFFVENFEGERSYVMNLGYLEQGDGGYYLTDAGEQSNLLETFQNFGINVGLVHIEYNINEGGWTVSNFLTGDVVEGDCANCEEFVIPSADTSAADLSFTLSKGGRKFIASSETLQNLGGIATIDENHFEHSFGDQPSIIIEVNNNQYEFERPSSGQKVESLLFRNIGKNYVKVVKI